ncbi:MAG: anaerobic ribonucleoside-triphosphate reductase, partial [Candidatus Bathyarchaeota archaeon]
MTISERSRGVKVLKAVSSAVRLNILNLLFEKGSLSYTELMNKLKMNPSRDAGRFAYHLKYLLKADLMEADVESGKYRLTELGNMVVNVAEEVEERAVKRKRILVRASRFALEDFDANKIVDSLIKETGMSATVAQKVAKEAENRLVKSKTKYLTAPLIREVVNGILIERGLENYRHRLTRLGLPVHEVSKLLVTGISGSRDSAPLIMKTGKAVMEEYTLLNILPRDISDSHLSGALHLNDLAGWVLRPNEIIHDVRVFIENGLRLDDLDHSQPFQPPPSSLESALSIIFNVLLRSLSEVYEAQTIDYFNVFLAPFIRNIQLHQVKEKLRLFFHNLSQHTNTTLGLELGIPDFVANMKVAGAPEKIYGDFNEETQNLTSLILEILAEESKTKPLFNPKLVVKIRPETLIQEKAKELLSQTHHLAMTRGMPYFANLTRKQEMKDVYSGSGFKFMADFQKDWEIDTLRTGNLGYASLNLPRITLECAKDEADFFKVLKDRLEMISRALKIKQAALQKRGKTLLPFITKNYLGDPYIRLESSTLLINILGLKEAAQAFIGEDIHESQATQGFAEKIAKQVSDFTQEKGKKQKIRLLPSILPEFEAAERFVQLDIERYGIGKIKYSGTREKPFYSTIDMWNLEKEQYLKKLILEKKVKRLGSGGNMTTINLKGGEMKQEELVSLTNRLVRNPAIGLFTYHYNFTYCRNCKKS